MKADITIHNEITSLDIDKRASGEYQVKIDGQVFEVFQYRPVSDSFAKSQANAYVKGINAAMEIFGVGA